MFPFDQIGSIMNAVTGQSGGGGGNMGNSGPFGVLGGGSNDYSDAMKYAADANERIAQGQIAAQQFAMQMASEDRRAESANNLLLGLEGLDTKLQIAKLDYVERMNANENEHVENMAQIAADVDEARAKQAAENAVDTTNFLTG